MPSPLPNIEYMYSISMLAWATTARSFASPPGLSGTAAAITGVMDRTHPFSSRMLAASWGAVVMRRSTP